MIEENFWEEKEMLKEVNGEFEATLKSFFATYQHAVGQENSKPPIVYKGHVFELAGITAVTNGKDVTTVTAYEPSITFDKMKSMTFQIDRTRARIRIGRNKIIISGMRKPSEWNPIIALFSAEKKDE